MRGLCAASLALAFAAAAGAQRLDPVKWSLAVEPAAAPPGAAVTARLTARIDEGWHLYSLTTPKGGANPTTVQLAQTPAAESWKVYQPKPITKFDPNFGLDTETFDREAVFLIAVNLSRIAEPGPVDLTAQIRYQACTDKLCLNPARRTATAALKVDPAAAAPALRPPPDGYLEFMKGAAGAPSAAPALAGTQQGFGSFLAVAFGFGLASIFTPCVFPMIPITMSFFLNQGAGSRGRAVIQAVTFCLGIVVAFTALGLALTAALGPFGVVHLASNPWVNAVLSLVFFAFALSLLGAYEITLPSGLLTRLDQASQKGGIAGTLLMGLTFSLTAFSCVGPFVGSLLAASVQGSRLEPLAGMATFAFGLSLPFVLLALFPAYLKRMPKSGGWLARVKVVMGFIVLAVMLKYAANVDQVLQANVLTRERFLAIWVALFTAAGLYLMGLLRLPGVKPDEELGAWRLLTGVAFVAFGLSLVPGMFGAPLGEFEAYVPPPSADSALRGGQTAGLKWIKDDYQAALAQAKQENKLVFISFTGYACSNCHWMKANMFPRAEIAAALGQYVLVELYTDGLDPASERNQTLQESKFQMVAVPFYAIVDANENIVATFAGATRKTAEFRGFLERKTASGG